MTRTVSLTTNFESTVEKVYSWMAARGHRTTRQPINYGIKFSAETAAGTRIVVLYRSSKRPGTRLVIQDPEIEDASALCDHLAGETVGAAPLEVGKIDSTLSAFADVDHVGSDEAGKGDYFGPIVVCALYAPSESFPLLREIGVRDSKDLVDRDSLRTASAIEQVCTFFKRVSIAPERYNEMHAAMGSNLNRVLGWMHLTAIDDVLGQLEASARQVPGMVVVVDQFASAGLLIRGQSARMQTTTLFQTPRAERDVVVAAASIMARAGFLQGLDRLSAQAGVRLPKGASAQVDAAGRELVKRLGPGSLVQYAKRHFKNTERVLQGIARS